MMLCDKNKFLALQIFFKINSCEYDISNNSKGGECYWQQALTLYSIITPSDAFEILCIWKYYGKWSICSFGANAPFSMIFFKVFKT